MMYQEQDGHVTVLDGDTLTVDGVRYEIPDRIRNRSSHRMSNIDGKVYIDWYRFDNGKFRWSLAAVLNYFF
jgi:hypothetical protein